MAFSAFWAEFFGVIFYGSKDGVNCFVIDAINMAFTVWLAADEVAFEQRLEIVAYHALFLSQSGSEFAYTHRFVHKLFEGCEARWVCQVGEEAVTGRC